MIAADGLARISRRALPWGGILGLAAPFLDEGVEGNATSPAILHVLVVDDETSSRTVTARMLRDAGFQVHEAASGKEALKYVIQHPEIRLAVVDIVMPEMNGVTLATQLPNIAPACQVILMTGYTPEGLGLGHLVSRYPLLVKPFDPAELKAKVRDVLRIGDS
jgi:CheY-like chemotaxis protein